MDDATLYFATPSSVTRQHNAITAAGEGSAADDQLSIETDDGTYLVGNAVDDGEGRQLFDGQEEYSGEVLARAFEAMLAGATDDDVERIAHVTLPFAGSQEQASVLSDLGFEVTPIDPGMAVIYDRFDGPSTAVGICLANGQAVATVAVEGLPVATAAIEFRDRWYDVSDVDTALDDEGPLAEWVAIQYEALIADLAMELQAETPAIADTVDVAVGGGRAPLGFADRIEHILETELGVSIGSVEIANDPAESPARGAQIAAAAATDRAPARPAFAADVGYAPELVDVQAATSRFEATGGMHRAKTAEGGHADTGEDTSQAGATDAGANAPDKAVVAGSGATAAEPSVAAGAVHERIARHRDRLARAHALLVERLDASDPADQLASLRADLEGDLERLEERAAASEAVADIEESLATLEGTYEDLEDDVSEIRAVLGGVADDASFDVSEELSEGIDSMAIDALQEDIEDVQDSLSNRIDRLWEELDDINDDLLDVRAGVDDIADIEDDLSRTQSAVDDLSGDLDDVRRTITDLSSTLDDLEQRAATKDDLSALESDVQSLSEELGAIDDRLRNLDVADPEEVRTLERDLSAIQDSVTNQASRLEGVERTTSDLEDRISQAFKDTAKAEAVSSVQADVSRMRNTVSDANEKAENAAEIADQIEGRVDSLSDSIASLQGDVEQLRKRLDGVVESSATRAEVDDSISEFEQRLFSVEQDMDSEFDRQDERIDDALGDVDQRIEQFGSRGAATEEMLQTIALGLAGGGVIAAWIAWELAQEDLIVQEIAFAFGLLMVGPGLYLFYKVSQ